MGAVFPQSRPIKMTFPSQLLGLTSVASLAFVLLLLFTTPVVAAKFTNSFTNLSYGSAVRLTWDTISPEFYPLFITAQLIDKGENTDGNESGGGGGVTAYKMNITTAAIDSSSSDKNAFEWTGIPSPLRWLPEGIYQVELHGGSADGTGTTPLAKSPFFAVGQPPYASGTEGGSKPATSSSGDEVRFLFAFPFSFD
ncbi:hypothetical protein SMACR_02712 [Sordaria macrospora]|uniref:WGS project CABT00000000 data, contig 2.11 n=2 Tax=Sordaria macrospora TaxID=5147 RepID=F7VX92_SORMK|nr:uncharacterized protein SMAC_02712 [Sordaria macrospora k-hell]KAA8636350.1 hypothetical protein SMACR_02712 [Sordaria macrospora]WPJ60458.1 hypothetical protein SMAC4_02712 [Sordaria macrospora]CCC10134.1 unnamed protein product [Sordaria macrospora k-hell]